MPELLIVIIQKTCEITARNKMHKKGVLLVFDIDFRAIKALRGM